uniref:Large ribosomal subunit protein uL29 n=1 Tax=uncultured Microgenomates bacterium Rifle_16ft_4_minimus_5036 TaxID=1665119 RepID=A0A0H4T906_9BACT|nr:coiled-coil 59..80 [uncultured Microgenomates bacterium Rifle_16ft_4_minimus_5036]
MKRKEIEELRKKDRQALEKLVSEKKTVLVKTVTDTKIAREKNLKKAKNTKREIAQIETVLREKEILEKEKGEEKA